MPENEREIYKKIINVTEDGMFLTLLRNNIDIIMYEQDNILSVVNTYKPLKEKYEKTLKELNELKSGLVKAEGVPDFLFSSEVSNEEVYSYLRGTPKASRFIYRKYIQNKGFIEELCDLENPLYLPEVADQLKEKFQITEIKEDISKLQVQKVHLQGEIKKLSDEIDEKSSQISELDLRLLPLKVDVDVLEKEAANIRSDPGLEKIRSFLDLAEKISRVILDDNRNVQLAKQNKRLLELEQLELINAMRSQASMLKDYLKTEDFYSQAKLDEVRAKLKNDIDETIEDNRTFTGENIGKNMEKVIEVLNAAISPYGDLSGSEVFVARQIGQSVGIVREGIKLLEKSKIRYENIKRNIK